VAAGGGEKDHCGDRRWSHKPPDAQHPKPRLSPNYVHAKVAIIDNKWATVGSAILTALR
jgi:phosphatidylserine/phosphatidylglycerophosphate/cardiolipin synthase-like enzyme